MVILKRSLNKINLKIKQRDRETLASHHKWPSIGAFMRKYMNQIVLYCVVMSQTPEKERRIMSLTVKPVSNEASEGILQ